MAGRSPIAVDLNIYAWQQTYIHTKIHKSHQVIVHSPLTPTLMTKLQYKSYKPQSRQHDNTSCQFLKVTNKWRFHCFSHYAVVQPSLSYNWRKTCQYKCHILSSTKIFSSIRRNRGFSINFLYFTLFPVQPSFHAEKVTLSPYELIKHIVINAQVGRVRMWHTLRRCPKPKG